MNLANKLSVLRILLIPLFVVCIIYYSQDKDYLRFIALSIFILAVITDAIDGYIARIKSQRTELGTYLDPIADKLLLIVAFVSLSVIKTLPEDLRLPPWIPVVIISRDAILLIGAGILLLLHRDLKISPTKLGKLTTFFQMLTIIVVLLRFSYSFIIWSIALLFTILSGIDYLRKGSKAINSIA